MTTRTILAAVAALVAAALTTTALAASTLKDPKTMVLQKSDFPAGARLAKKVADKSPQYSSYAAEYRYKIGANTYYLISTANVMDRRAAVTVFRQARGLLQHGYQKISLPKYGDEQVAGLAREDNAGELWVRKGGVVWALTVNTADLASGLITKAESIAQLKRFGPKQMKHVGSG